MLGRVALVFLLLGLFGDGSATEGRRGNALFEQEKYAEAERAYRAGLAAHDDTTGSVYVGLQNNLGAALHRQKRYAEARSAFTRAARATETADARARALFNAGTAAAGLGNLAMALQDYREVLLLKPSHHRARYNYEYLKRQLSKRQPRPRPANDVEPSAYARRLKRKAETLVARKQYAAARDSMTAGLRADSTVRAYRGFIQRLETVAEIESTP